MFNNLKRYTGSYKLNNPFFLIGIFALALFFSFIIAKVSFQITIVLMLIPLVLVYLNRLFTNPRIGLITIIILAWLAVGITRYIQGIPFGLTIDLFLVMTLVAVFFRTFYDGIDKRAFNNDIVILLFLWFLYAVAEIMNPEALSKTAWFYAMRGVALYSLLTVPLVFLLFKKVKYLNIFLYIWGVISILGSIKGMQQIYFGLDYAEQRWLNEVGYITHILFGELRVFSFYTDAGQFGAAQGAAGLVGILVALNSKNTKDKVFFFIMGITGIWGMMISGTRGAIIVPLIGSLLYLIHRKNLRVIMFGLVIIAGIYVFFKYTYIGSGVSQIRRMRTAFFPADDASLQVRLDNRKVLQVYLASRPFGGGIGSAGNWGLRFSPNGFLANVATDSWYVQIWAEMGIIGLTFHLFILAYILTKSSYLIMFRVKDPELRGKLSALACAYAGVLGASYGNGVLGQIPTGILTYISWGFLFMAPILDREVRGLPEPSEEIISR